MNEFDNNEEYYKPQGSESQPRQDTTEANTTYHYSYNNQSGSQQNPYQSTTSYYTPPQSSDYRATDSGAPFNSGTGDNGAPNPPFKKKKSKAKTALILVFIACVVFAVAGIIFAATNGTSQTDKGEANTQPNNDSSSEVTTEAQGDVAKTDTDGNYTVAGIAENFIDSCVGITVYTQANNFSNFYNYGYSYGQNQQQGSSKEQVSGEGSGIVMLESGNKTYILTCAHVISDGSSFKVTLNDGTVYDASMVAYDSQTDIGVLSISATGLHVASFADSDSTVLGEQVVAIGCPGGLEFMNSITSGYVSALARPVSSTIGYNTECIQTDAAINPGNSGGALFNMNGQVIGVNSSKIASTEYEGMGFAVPSNTAVQTANSLIKSGYVEGRAKIGITYKSITSYSNSDSILSALAQLGFENANGTMVINEVSSDSDLANKDIREYDMIVAVNGKTLTSTDVMTSVLAESKPGDTLKLTIARIENNNIDTFETDCVLIESKG